MRSALRLIPCALAATGLLLLAACQRPADTAPPPAVEPPAAGPPAAPPAVTQPAEPTAAPAPVASGQGLEGLDEALALAVQQLEEKKYAQMLERFVAPADREKVKAEGGSWEKIAEGFGQAKAPQLLERLQLARGQKAELSADGVRAVYPGKPGAPGMGDRELVWERVDGAWYLRN
jgi:hypothetical protein